MGQVTGKWQAFFIDIDGNKCGPAGPIGTFAGAVAFCRGYLSRGLSSDVVSGSIPIPMRVDQPIPRDPLDEPKLDQSMAWIEVWCLCRELGMEVGPSGRGIDQVRDFIQKLAKQAKQSAQQSACTAEPISGINGSGQSTGVTKGQSILGVVNQHRAEQQVAPKAEKLNRDYLVGPAISCKEPELVTTTLDEVNKELDGLAEAEASNFRSDCAEVR